MSAPRAMSGTTISASGSSGVPGTKRTRGSRWAWFASTGSRCSTAQPVIPSPNGKRSLQDLVRVLAAHERRHELALRLVGLVDVQRLVRDDLGERVGDPHEQRVEALLGEQVVEDVREPAVGVDRRVAAGRQGTRNQPHPRSAGERGGASGFVHGHVAPGAGTARGRGWPRHLHQSCGRYPVSALPRSGDSVAAVSPSIEGLAASRKPWVSLRMRCSVSPGEGRDRGGSFRGQWCAGESRARRRAGRRAQELRRQRRPGRDRPRGRERRGADDHRPERQRQEHAAALRQPARAARTPAGSSSRARRSRARAPTSRRVRQRIGMVFQQFNLFPHLTVIDNLTLAARRIRKLSAGGGGGARPRSCSRAVGLAEKARSAPAPALRRPAAAGRDRARADDGAARDAVRRGHLGARSRSSSARC